MSFRETRSPAVKSTLLVAAMGSSLLFGCATGGPSLHASKGSAVVMVLPPRLHAVRGGGGVRDDLQRLAHHVIDKGGGGSRAIALAELQQRLSKRKRHGERTCLSLECQRRLGPTLFGATHSLTVVLSGRRHCSAKATLYDLRLPRERKARRRALREARFRGVVRRATGRCPEGHGALAALLSKVVCQMAAPRGTPQELCMLHGELFWLDREADGLISIQLKLGQGKIAERILDIKGALLHLARRSPPELAVAAHCRVGRLYDQLSQVLDIPGQSQGQSAAGFRRHALQLYRECLARAAKSAVVSEATRRAERRVAALALPPSK